MFGISKLESERAGELLSKAAEKIAPELATDDVEVLSRCLFAAWQGLHVCVIFERDAESGPEARKHLRNLAQRARELINEFDALGLLARRMVSKLSESQAAPLEGMDWRMGNDLAYEEYRDGWVARLESLEELAKAADGWFGQATGRGGRKSLMARLQGSPEDNLAYLCTRLAQSYGCDSQATVQRMVQMVMEVEYGKKAMKQIGGKPAKDKGRKAVRKMAQTKGE